MEGKGGETVTVEQATAALKSVVAEMFVEIEKRMDLGERFDTALMTICRERPDLIDRENQLRDYIKGLGRAAFGISALEIKAAFDRPNMGTISCATRLEGGAVKRLPIAQLGIRYKGKQKIEITRAMLSQVVTNYRKRETGEVPIDYDHAIETAAGSGAPVPAAGWIKSLDDAPDANGILWGTVQWTAKAAGMIQAGEYKYISPVLDPTVRDNKLGIPQGWTLTSAALTNQPVLQGMPALVLSELTPGDGWGGDRGNSTMTQREELQNSRTELARVDVELDGLIRAAMREHGINYSQAFTRVNFSHRDLMTRRLGLTRAVLSKGSYCKVPEAAADVEIGTLVRARIAASEGRIDYGTALKAVLSERPDLARRHMDAM